MSFTRPAIVLFLLIALVGVLFLRHGNEERPVTVERSRIIMGTVVVITAIGENEARLDEAVTTAFEEMSRLERLLSAHLPDSEVSRLSRSAHGLKVSADTLNVVDLGLKAARSSKGDFDLTLGRLKDLWSIEGASPRIPSDEQIADALQGTGPDSLQIEGSRISKKDPDLHIDLGGIAKGYAVDRALEVLAKKGIAHASVNAGGDLRVRGSKISRPWRIGIQHPRRKGEVIAVVPLENRALVTSGDYERYFELDGVRYHHLFDPETGRPARGCMSVSVVAETTAWADALATIAFVRGPEKGMDFLENQEDVEALIIDAEGRRLVTDGLRERLEWR